MVYLNGKFIPKENAMISVMDRGFLFADSIYEVIPVYKGKCFQFDSHLKRLANNLKLININNPKTKSQWHETINKLISYNQSENQYIYLQITRGCDTERDHFYNNLKPTVYIESSALKIKSKKQIMSGFSAITKEDIRWGKCNIKTSALIANIMYAQAAKENNAEEVILIKNNIVTECFSSNVFIVKNNILYTHPKNSAILPGITRKTVIQCALEKKIQIIEKFFTKEELFAADEVLISSSKRELIPITKIDNIAINAGEIGNIWSIIYDAYQEKK